MNLIDLYDKFSTRIIGAFSVLFIINMIIGGSFIISILLTFISIISTYYFLKKRRYPETAIWAALAGFYLYGLFKSLL